MENIMGKECMKLLSTNAGSGILKLCYHQKLYMKSQSRNVERISFMHTMSTQMRILLVNISWKMQQNIPTSILIRIVYLTTVFHSRQLKNLRECQKFTLEYLHSWPLVHIAKKYFGGRRKMQKNLGRNFIIYWMSLMSTLMTADTMQHEFNTISNISLKNTQRLNTNGPIKNHIQCMVTMKAIS